MTLFDILNEITQRKTLQWEDLSESDQKQFNTYMVNRYLSMNSNWIELINILQKYTVGFLSSREVYKLYMNLIPQTKVFLKYVKGIKEDKYQPVLIETLCKHFECGIVTSEEYAHELYKTEAGKSEMKEILQRYGVDEKQIKKCKLQ